MCQTRPGPKAWRIDIDIVITQNSTHNHNHIHITEFLRSGNVGARGSKLGVESANRGTTSGLRLGVTEWVMAGGWWLVSGTNTPWVKAWPIHTHTHTHQRLGMTRGDNQVREDVRRLAAGGHGASAVGG